MNRLQKKTKEVCRKHNSPFTIMSVTLLAILPLIKKIIGEAKKKPTKFLKMGNNSYESNIDLF